MEDDMIILTRTYDLLLWLVPKAETFPKVYRFSVTHRLLNCALDFQESLFDAQSQGGSMRHKHLRAADAQLNKLRVYLRLAHQWRWLTGGQYEHVSRLVAEVGRLLGAWLKVA